MVPPPLRRPGARGTQSHGPTRRVRSAQPFRSADTHLAAEQAARHPAPRCQTPLYPRHREVAGARGGTTCVLPRLHPLDPVTGG